MAFGLQVFDAAGSVRLDTSDKITRLIHSRIIPAAESSSVTLSNFDSTKGIAFTTSLGTTNYALAHQVKSEGNTITWIAGMRNDPGARPTGTDSLLLVFMYG